MSASQPGSLTSMQHEPTVVERSPQPYVGITRPITMSTFAAVADEMPGIFGWLRASGIEPVGAPFFRYWVIDMERELVVEAGVPVAPAVHGEGDIRPGTLPGGRYLTVTHTGHPHELVDVTAAFLAWAGDHGLTFAVEPSPEGDRWGCRLELLLTDPAEVPEMQDWQTQLCFQLA
jgi:effector-binding domain-containing protein